MSIGVGIGFAFVAMLCWGVGDFLIQRSVRRHGDVETIFLITLFGVAILFPFVYRDLPSLFSVTSRGVLYILLATGLLHLIAAFLELESLRRGKIAVVEPIWSFEIFPAALFAFLFLGERMTALQLGIVLLLIVGLFLVSFRGSIFVRQHLLERGVYFAVAGALTMGAAGFFTGWSARLADPLMANFVVCVFLTLYCGTHLLVRGRIIKPFSHLISFPKTLLSMVILDNTAWVAYAFAMSLVPIGIATALSESYLIIAVLLGLSIGRERLLFHQKVGIVCSVGAAIVLAGITV